MTFEDTLVFLRDDPEKCHVRKWLASCSDAARRAVLKPAWLSQCVVVIGGVSSSRGDMLKHEPGILLRHAIRTNNAQLMQRVLDVFSIDPFTRRLEMKWVADMLQNEHTWHREHPNKSHWCRQFDLRGHPITELQRQAWFWGPSPFTVADFVDNFTFRTCHARCSKRSTHRMRRIFKQQSQHDNHVSIKP
jgi:hypothetical protein